VAKKRLDYTPKSQIISALRRLFLRSRERSYAIKRDKYTCQVCGKKQSKAAGREVEVEVHHTCGVTNWNEIEDTIRMYLLTDPEDLRTLCKACHGMEHGEKS
jgi:5-methylcytosine-specific restriction endonuclease McrA